MCCRWCQSNGVVKDAGFHIVNALQYDSHWIPVWASPSSQVLQFHLVDSERFVSSDMDQLFWELTQSLGFHERVLQLDPC